MNADGFALLRSLEQMADDERVKWIEIVNECSAYSETEQRVQLAGFQDFSSKEKIHSEQQTAFLLLKLLMNDYG